MSFNNEQELLELLNEFLSSHMDVYDDLAEALDDFLRLHPLDEDDAVLFQRIINKAMSAHEDLLELTPEVESMQLLDRAIKFPKSPKRNALLTEAIELYPENWYAHLELIDLDGSPLEYIDQLRDLESTAREAWLDIPRSDIISPEEYSYLTIKATLAESLMTEGFLIEARHHFQEVYDLDEADPLDTRYLLMAIHCRLYDWESALELFYDIPYPANTDEQMIAPLLILAILTGNNSYAKDLFHDLCRVNHEVGQLFQDQIFPIERIIMVEEADVFEPGSFESLAVALKLLLPILLESDYLYEWLLREYHSEAPHRKINLSDKIISFEGASHLYKQSSEDKKGEGDVLEGVVHNAAETLKAKGLVTATDFSQFTEKEIGNIKHVGPKTIQQLKRNGVVFKEDH